MNVKPFQIIVLAVFALLAIGGVITFAMYRGFSEDAVTVGKVEIWGTLPREVVEIALDTAKEQSQSFNSVSYVEKNPDTFSDEYIEALAEGRGPELIIISGDRLYERLPTLLPIPYTSYPERDFKDTYVGAAELFLMPEGLYGIPFTLDPLITIWNRTLFNANGIARPPQYWEELYTLAPKITEKNEKLTVLKSAVALGEFGNIQNAKEIMVAMLLQSGNTLVSRDTNGNLVSSLGARKAGLTAPAEDVLRFFTEFSNPTKNTYSWNRSLPEAQRAFISGDVGVYFGFASEIFSIREANPNLDFDVAPFLETKGSDTPSTVGVVTAFAIPKASKNIEGAYQVALKLSSSEVLSVLSEQIGLPPVRRDLLVVEPTDPTRAMFARQALITEAWLDPDPEGSDTLFKSMIDAVTTGRLTIREAVSAGSQQLDILLRQ